LLILPFSDERKEVNKMKKAKVIFATLLLLGNIAVSRAALATDGVIVKVELAPGSNYCHEKFPAIDPSTLDSDQPTLKSSDTGDIVDFYGPCDESPTGEDQVWQQKQDRLFWQDAQ
jgi:hypothetical protein